MPSQYRVNKYADHSVIAANDKKGQGIASSVIMWIFAIVPVYGFAGLCDLLIFNLIEFWTGKTTKVYISQNHPDGSESILNCEGNIGILQLKKDGRLIDEITMIRNKKGVLKVKRSNGETAYFLCPQSLSTEMN